MVSIGKASTHIDGMLTTEQWLAAYRTRGGCP